MGFGVGCCLLLVGLVWVFVVLRFVGGCVDLFCADCKLVVIASICIVWFGC